MLVFFVLFLVVMRVICHILIFVMIAIGFCSEVTIMANYVYRVTWKTMAKKWELSKTSHTVYILLLIMSSKRDHKHQI